MLGLTSFWISGIKLMQIKNGVKEVYSRKWYEGDR